MLNRNGTQMRVSLRPADTKLQAWFAKSVVVILRETSVNRYNMREISCIPNQLNVLVLVLLIPETFKAGVSTPSFKRWPNRYSGGVYAETKVLIVPLTPLQEGKPFSCLVAQMPQLRRTTDTGHLLKQTGFYFLALPNTIVRFGAGFGNTRRKSSSILNTRTGC